VDSQPVVLRRYPAVIHAELAKSALAAYEIEAVVQKGPYHHLAKTFDLLVRPEDVVAALEILGPEETFSD
jgi:hypothetical protein